MGARPAKLEGCASAQPLSSALVTEPWLRLFDRYRNASTVARKRNPPGVRDVPRGTHHVQWGQGLRNWRVALLRNRCRRAWYRPMGKIAPILSECEHGCAGAQPSRRLGCSTWNSLVRRGAKRRRLTLLQNAVLLLSH